MKDEKYTTDDIIHAFLESADEVALERFMDTLYAEIQSDEEPFDKKARLMLSAVLADNATDVILNLCGWTPYSLLKKAGLVPDVDGQFHERIKEAEFVSLWDGERTEIATKCKVNMETFEVFDIERSEDDEVEVCDGEYVRFNKDPEQQYPVFRKEELQEPIVNFWYY